MMCTAAILVFDSAVGEASVKFREICEVLSLTAWQMNALVTVSGAICELEYIHNGTSS